VTINSKIKFVHLLFARTVYFAYAATHNTVNLSTQHRPQIDTRQSDIDGPSEMEVDASVFKIEGSDIMSRAGAKAATDSRFSRRFSSAFGVKAYVCPAIWNMLESSDVIKVENRHPKHLLWALMFLKVYASEDVLAALAGVHVNTLRKWLWIYVKAVAKLNVVRTTCYSRFVGSSERHKQH